MLKKVLVITAVLSIISCSDTDDTPESSCGVSDPKLELEWLKTEITNREANLSEDSKYCYIEQADLQGQTVFIYQDCNPAINKVIPVYDCSGNQIGLLHSDISPNSLNEGFILWKTADFACTQE